MDNIKYYNDSLAYDFEMFMPKSNTASGRATVVEMPKSRAKATKRRTVAAKRISASAFAIMTSVFMLAALCGNIALRIRINEVNTEINDVKSSISELNGEKTELEVEMQRRISYANIELEATQLGMQKMNKDQVVYIRVNDKDSAVDAKGNILKNK